MTKLMKIITTFLAGFALLFFGGQASAQTVNTGAGGSASITIENASQGQTYTIYKLFDATVDGNGGISYKVPSGKSFTGNDFFTVDNAGNILAKDNIDVSSAAFKSWAESFGSEVTSATAEDNTLVFSNLTYGYYYVKSSLGATITVDSTNPDATVKDKNTTKPNIPDDNAGGGKKILVNGQTVDSTTAKVGDTVNYQIKFEATNFVTTSGTDSKQITKYTIVDTPTNLSIDQNSIVVKVAGQTISANVATTFDSNGKMTIVLTWADNSGKSIYNSPSEVVITYDAIVTKGAADADATNTAQIGYNTSDQPNDDPTPVDPENPDNTTTVKTYQLAVNKTDGTNALTGATFKLYDAKTGGNEIKVVKVSDGVYRVAESGETGVEIEAGTAVIKGLKGDSTNYYLEETKAPNGYNILTERQETTIASNNDNKAEVVNKMGAELPSTGSVGTTLFYIIGSLLILAAIIYMIASRRMNKI